MRSNKSVQVPFRFSTLLEICFTRCSMCSFCSILPFKFSTSSLPDVTVRLTTGRKRIMLSSNLGSRSQNGLHKSVAPSHLPCARAMTPLTCSAGAPKALLMPSAINGACFKKLLIVGSDITSPRCVTTSRIAKIGFCKPGPTKGSSNSKMDSTIFATGAFSPFSPGLNRRIWVTDFPSAAFAAMFRVSVISRSAALVLLPSRSMSVIAKLSRDAELVGSMISAIICSMESDGASMHIPISRRTSLLTISAKSSLPTAAPEIRCTSIGNSGSLEFLIV
mmetsp:Transcript_12765/g.25024  ORF Transcript_12765/g.25024 Transcript_12765/m.25024 type:complete len:277 (-) Transcript_12765:984-1814(-)